MKFHQFCLTSGLFLLLAPAALADTLYLQDGSVIHGELSDLDGGHYIFETKFAGELKVDATQVAGIDTETSHAVTLKDGDVVGARLAYDADSGQRIISNEFGARSLETVRLTAIQDIATLTAPPKREDVWTGRLSAGISGSSGNTRNRTIDFRAKAMQQVDGQRLIFSAQVHKRREESTQTEDETIALARLERDFTERFFLFGETQAEKDEFENIDLRFRATVGPGYFFLKREGHTLKGRAGLGYEQESYTDGSNESSAILTLGVDYLLEVNDFFRLTYGLTAIPEIDNDPADNYRLDSVIGAELPIGDSSLWALRGEYEQQYDSSPEPGVERLDTTYLLSIVRDFK